VASLGKKPRERSHFAVKFAAGAMRVAALLVLIGGAGLVFALFNAQQIQGAEALAFTGVVTFLLAIFIVASAVVWALILWGFADGLVLLADIDDAQRRTQREVADLMLETRTARGPFHAEAVATKETEKLIR